MVVAISKISKSGEWACFLFVFPPQYNFACFSEDVPPELWDLLCSWRLSYQPEEAEPVAAANTRPSSERVVVFRASLSIAFPRRKLSEECGSKTSIWRNPRKHSTCACFILRIKSRQKKTHSPRCVWTEREKQRDEQEEQSGDSSEIRQQHVWNKATTCSLEQEEPEREQDPLAVKQEADSVMGTAVDKKSDPQQHFCQEDKLYNQEMSSSLDQVGTETQQNKDEQEETEPLWTKEEQQEPVPLQIKQEEEEPQPPRIKEEPPELCTSEAGEQLELKQESDIVMVTVTDEHSKYSEPESDGEQVISHDSDVDGSQGYKKRQHIDSESPTNREVKPNSRRHSRNMGNSPMSENQCETDISKKCLTCDFCGKTFKCISQVQVHQRTHTGEKPYSCETCGKGFRRQDHLLVHMRTHTGEKPHSCETCGKRFSQRSSMLFHLRTHTGEKPYSCTTCGKSFSYQSSLLFHMKSHLGEKPYSCATCGKSFSRQNTVLVHMRTHTGEKPYSCETCGKSFSQNSTLLVHMRGHTGEKPFFCEPCGKSFTRQRNLLIHMKSHTRVVVGS